MIKTFLLSPDAQGRIDGTIKHTLLDHFPHQVSSIGQADVVVIPVSFYGDYQFNEALLALNKPVVIIDFLEYGTAWNPLDDNTHLIGSGYLPTNVRTPEWERLDRWAHEKADVVAYFKRELLESDRNTRILPVEFPCHLPLPPIVSRESFNNRRVEVLHAWGYSHPSRPLLHAEIFRGMAEHGLEVISEWNHWGAYRFPDTARVWASIYSPFYARQHISLVMAKQSEVKISVSLPGCGVKCFRHAESPVGAVMAKHLDKLAWSYPWQAGFNCVEMLPGFEFRTLDDMSRAENLYDIYVAGQETIAKYAQRPYMDDYIIPAIERLL